MDSAFRLHHVGILVADVGIAAGAFADRFGYVRESACIHDPMQAAYVQFLRLPGADHWTELVAPDGPDSHLHGALKRRKGGAHHLCFEVAGIEDACAGLRDQSMMLLGPPVPAVAFGGRRIAWLLDREGFLVELVESGPGPLSLPAP